MSSARSLCVSALMKSRPIPGHAKIVSVTMAPASKLGSDSHVCGAGVAWRVRRHKKEDLRFECIIV